MNQKNLFWVGSLFIVLGLITTNLFGATDYVRVNQIGYLPSDTKVAVAFSKTALSTLTFSVINNSGGATLWGPTAFPTKYTGGYAPFTDVYLLDFSAYQPSSSVTCYVQLSDGTQSVTFGIGTCVYQGTEEAIVNFFRIQNCGTGNWYGGTSPGGTPTQANCHLAPGTSGFTSDEDGEVVDGPNAGTLIDEEGGWHDSGDFIKFGITLAWVDELLMFAYQQYPSVFQDNFGSNLQPSSNGVPDILDEARYGLNYLIKLNPNSTTYYYDVGDARDYLTNFGDLPENDVQSYCTAGVTNATTNSAYATVGCGYRPVYGGTNDQGGSNNCARAAGALAMGYQIWNAPSSFQDTTFASTCLTHAQWLYALAKAQNLSTQIDVDDAYEENSGGVSIDMEMAAVQLYKATGNASYLTDAQDYSAAGSANGELDWNTGNFLAHFCLYQVAPSTTLQGYLQSDLNTDLANSNAADNPYSMGYTYVWGTNENLTSLTMMSELYDKQFAVTTYANLGTFNRDFVLGRNPWGCCFIQGMGSVSPLHPQHNIAIAMFPTIATGVPIEGPASYTDFSDANITLSVPPTDPFGAFDNNKKPGWCYHDDDQDYVTNEVTSTHAGMQINVFAYLASQCGTSNPTSTPTQTSTNSPTRTPTPSATLTATATQTSSPTATLTYTATLTATSSATNSPTLSATWTPSFTITSTPTLTGTDSPTDSPTGTLSPTLSFTPTNTLTLSPTSTLTYSPTPTPSNSATSSASSTSTSSATATTSSTPTLTPTSTGTSSPSPTAPDTSTSTPTSTLTVTPTPTYTTTLSPTNSFTPTSTSTSTPTQTFTDSSTSTKTLSPTSTATSTPLVNNPILYPNPSNGTQPVHLSLPLSKNADVTIQIFTVAFRKVEEHTFISQPAGLPLSLILNDTWGNPLASGLYYVTVNVNGTNRSILKLLLLR